MKPLESKGCRFCKCNSTLHPIQLIDLRWVGLGRNLNLLQFLFVGGVWSEVGSQPVETRTWQNTSTRVSPAHLLISCFLSLPSFAKTSNSPPAEHSLHHHILAVSSCHFTDTTPLGLLFITLYHSKLPTELKQKL